MATMSVQKRYNSSCVTMRLTPFFTFSEEKAAQEVPSAVFSVPEAIFLQPRIAIMAGGVYNGEKSGGVRPLEGSDP